MLVTWIRITVIRLVVSAVVLLGVFTATFVMMRLAPGDPFHRMDAASPQTLENLKQAAGLDRPLAEQYLTTLAGYVKGDFGTSLTYAPGRPVAAVLASALPVSLELGLYALLLALVLGIWGGMAAGMRQGTWFDKAAGLVALALISASVIVVSALLRKLLIVEGSPFKLGGFDRAANKALPALALGLAYAAIFQRLVRANVAAQISRGMMRAVQARGVGGMRSTLKYLLPQTLIPMLDWMGPAVTGILTGSFVVESLFEVPGVSACFVQGAQARDYALVSGAITVYAVFLVSLNLLFETIHGLLDPRAGERQVRNAGCGTRT
jgi:oligopeptide transport system permease protein